MSDLNKKSDSETRKRCTLANACVGRELKMGKVQCRIMSPLKPAYKMCVLLSVVFISFAAEIFAADKKNEQCVQICDACRVLLDSEKNVDQKALQTMLSAARSGFSAEVRYRAMSICTLAEVIKGEQAQYELAFAGLSAANPNADYTRRANSDYLSEKCSVCNGRGKSGKITCTACKGNKICNKCKGARKLRVTSGPRQGSFDGCPECHGLGRCNTCRGTGQEDGVCERCKGKKLILANNKATLELIKQVKELNMMCYLTYHQDKGPVSDALCKYMYTYDKNKALEILKLSLNGAPKDAKYDEAKRLFDANEQESQNRLRKSEMARNQTESAKGVDEPDTDEFAIEKAVKYVRNKIEQGTLIDAEFMEARSCMFPFAGEARDFYSKRLFVYFNFKYMTNAGFERVNRGPVQMAYREEQKKWLIVDFNESSITGVSFWQTNQGKEMMGRAIIAAYSGSQSRDASKKADTKEPALPSWVLVNSPESLDWSFTNGQALKAYLVKYDAEKLVLFDVHGEQHEVLNKALAGKSQDQLRSIERSLKTKSD